MKKIILSTFLTLAVAHGIAQELMQKIEDSEVSILLDNTAVVTLNDGTQTVGTVASIYLIKGRLIDVSLTLQDNSKLKFKPTEISTLKIRCLKPTMFSVVDDSGEVVRKIINTQFVFEHPFKSKNRVKPEMMQLLNPAFDRKIKIFADPSSGESRSISIKGSPLPGSNDHFYIFVKGESLTYVSRKSYRNVFKNIFGDCEKFVESIPQDEINYDAMVSHVLLYDHLCGEK